ncbi:MAG: Mth938-like domain-containing protein [Legionellales bacterium]
MHINLEATDQHEIQAYSANEIQINSIIYAGSLIVSREEITKDLLIKNIRDIDEDYLNLLLKSKPELIIIGHEQTGVFPPIEMISALSQQRIGIECMSIGAACRTFNVLLSEHRNVVAGFIFKPA